MRPSSAGRRTAAPTASIATAHTDTWAKRAASLPSGRARKLLSTMSYVDRDARWPKTRNRAVESVVIPSPPSWINARITTCPNVENSFPVSRTVRPVTHTALVAVNSASRKPIRAPAAARGRVSSSAPTRMAAANPPRSTRVGCRRSRCRQKPTVPHFEHEEWSTVPMGQEAVHASQDQAIRSRYEPWKSIGNSHRLFYCPHATRCPRPCRPTHRLLPLWRAPRSVTRYHSDAWVTYACHL